MCMQRNIYTRVRKISLFYGIDCMDFPSEGHISHELDRCMQCERACTCVSARAWVCARNRPNAPLSIWFSHYQCGKITLSIVDYMGIPSACNISLIHISSDCKEAS